MWRELLNPRAPTSTADIGDHLVTGGVRRYGRFDVPPSVINPLDEFGQLSRGLHRLRLKEWVGFALLQRDWCFGSIMTDAQYLASSVAFAYDRERRELSEYRGVARGGSLGLPESLLENRAEFRSPHYELSYDFSQSVGRHRIRFEIEPSKDAPAFRGVLELDARRASKPLSVSARLASGGPMYTHKAIFPAEGVLHVGERAIVFDPSRDVAILDEHKSFFPYRTRWRWGTFAMFTSDGLVGANFADHEMKPGHEEESCIWGPRACEPLANIRFEPQSAEPLAPWRIASGDGRLDVAFEPELRKIEQTQLGVAAVDYFQLAGHYSGTLRTAERTYDVARVYGICERMLARF